MPEIPFESNASNNEIVQKANAQEVNEALDCGVN